VSAPVCHHLKVVADNNRDPEKLPVTQIRGAWRKEQQDQPGTHEFRDDAEIRNSQSEI